MWSDIMHNFMMVSIIVLFLCCSCSELPSKANTPVGNTNSQELQYRTKWDGLRIKEYKSGKIVPTAIEGSLKNKIENSLKTVVINNHPNLVVVTFSQGIIDCQDNKKYSFTGKCLFFQNEADKQINYTKESDPNSILKGEKIILSNSGSKVTLLNFRYGFFFSKSM